MLGDNYPIFGNKEYYTPEDIVEMDITYNVKKAIKTLGLEGTEEVIKSVYNTVPILRDKMLESLYEIWRG